MEQIDVNMPFSLREYDEDLGSHLLRDSHVQLIYFLFLNFFTITSNHNFYITFSCFILDSTA